jgi:hypothetical protein
MHVDRQIVWQRRHGATPRRVPHGQRVAVQDVAGGICLRGLAIGGSGPAGARESGTNGRITEETELRRRGPGAPIAGFRQSRESHVSGRDAAELGGLLGLVVGPCAGSHRCAPGRSVRADRDRILADRTVAGRILPRQVGQPHYPFCRVHVDGDAVWQWNGRGRVRRMPERGRIAIDGVARWIATRLVAGRRRPPRPRDRSHLGRERVGSRRHEHLRGIPRHAHRVGCGIAGRNAQEDDRCGDPAGQAGHC